MEIIPEPVQFEWDKGNIDKNLKKHGVTNEEAEEIFIDQKAVLTEDINHAIIEKRYQILGRTESGKILNVLFTIRGKIIRIISARFANRKEWKLYDENA